MEIRIFNRTVNTSVLLGNLDAYATQLAQAKVVPGHALCLCTTPHRKLVIRAVNKRLFLAVWPHDGHNHHYACTFHRDEEEASNTTIGALPAVKETKDGFEIATDFQLTRIKRDEAGLSKVQDENLVITPHGQRPTRTRMGLLGVLYHLWKESGLNTWGINWKRDWWRVTQALLPVIEHGKVAGKAMTDCLYLVPEQHYDRKKAIDAAWESFKSALRPDISTSKMGLVLGEAVMLEITRYGFRMSMRHFAPFLYISNDLRNKLATSYPKAYHRFRSKQSQRVVALCLVELSEKGNVTVIDAALMQTSNHYIPVDSSHEALMADFLVHKNRSFIKPLSVRPGESTLPDFILTDTVPEYVLEVFGMNTPEYLERKINKKLIYKAEGKPVWFWEALLTPIPPELPSPAFSTKTRKAYEHPIFRGAN